jgi:hypothetical protein
MTRSGRPAVLIPPPASLTTAKGDPFTMATEQPTNTTPSPQSAELSGLARRLNARAESVLLRDQPEQQSDLRQAARFIEELIRLRSEIAAQSTSTDLYVDVTGDDGTSRRNVPLREAVGNDPDEYEDCRQTLLADGKCTTGGGAFPLRHLELGLDRDEELALLRAGIQRAIASTTDPVCRHHLRELLGGR